MYIRTKQGAEGVGVSEGWCFKANVWETEIKRASCWVYMAGAHCDLKTQHDQSGSGAVMSCLFFLFTDLSNPAGVIKIDCLFHKHT